MKNETEVFSMPFLEEADIERRAIRLHMLAWVLRALLGAGIFGAVFSGCTFPNWIGVVVLAACCAGLTVISWFFLALGLSLSTRWDWNDYCWLPSRSCDELVSLCDKNPGLLPYRDRVREAGRRFTCGEFYSMRNWTVERTKRREALEQEARERASCQRLYGITVTAEQGARK
ncbi:hypothetical protein AB4Y45_33455 [Paraburkholderia sp. EG287A]|uniref:hypothetical protein n=1 Tax=Paraburkholderia sp. EG287A TaxID=3237012 RepID=UPI0034D38B7B